MKYILPALLILLSLATTHLAAENNPTDRKATTADTSLDQPQRDRKKRTPWPVRVLRLIGVVAGIYVCFILVLFLLKDRFIYHPIRHPRGNWEQPALHVEDCTFGTSDGLRLHAWWRPAEDPDHAPTLLWFHGNAGNLTHRAENLSMIPRSVNVLLVDYRGYGKSQGHPTEKGLYLDGEAAYRYLTEERDIEPDHIIAYGRSLGTAVALQVATEREVAGLILESPFRSAGAMAHHMFPFIPGRLMLPGVFDNAARIGNLEVPLLVIHGRKDRIVPFKQGRALYDQAPEPKRFHPLPHAGHNDTYAAGGPDYFPTITGFARDCVNTPLPTGKDQP